MPTDVDFYGNSMLPDSIREHREQEIRDAELRYMAGGNADLASKLASMLASFKAMLEPFGFTVDMRGDDSHASFGRERRIVFTFRFRHAGREFAMDRHLYLDQFAHYRDEIMASMVQTDSADVIIKAMREVAQHPVPRPQQPVAPPIRYDRAADNVHRRMEQEIQERHLRETMAAMGIGSVEETATQSRRRQQDTADAMAFAMAFAEPPKPMPPAEQPPPRRIIEAKEDEDVPD